MNILSDVEQIAVIVAAGGLTACLPFAMAWINGHVKNQALAADIDKAVTIGVSVAHDALTAAVKSGGVNWDIAKSTAIAEGTNAAQAINPMATAADILGALEPMIAGNTALSTASVAPNGSAAPITVLPVAPSIDVPATSAPTIPGISPISTGV